MTVDARLPPVVVFVSIADGADAAPVGSHERRPSATLAARGAIAGLIAAPLPTSDAP